jgi:hypothetical protein
MSQLAKDLIDDLLKPKPLTLRQMMTETIKHYGFQDYHWKSIPDHDNDLYRDWLNDLSDEEFLDAYNRVRDSKNDPIIQT